MKKIIIIILSVFLSLSGCDRPKEDSSKTKDKTTKLETVDTKSGVKSLVEGNLNAKIKVEVFESLTCSHCADFHKNIYPQLKQDFIDKGYIYMKFRNFPLDKAALNASKIAHCKNDGNSEILHYLFENQRQWLKGSTIEEIDKNIKNIVKKSLFNLDIESCLNNNEVEDHILEDRIEGAKKFKVDATPTLIINGEKFKNPTNYKKLKKFLEKLI
ncbi:MAG: thioredoxin domain-containing protein [Candidatus Pelagibacter sp.]